MYIERFPGLPHGDWLRACVSVPFGNASNQTAALETVLRAARTVPKLAFALRLRYEPGQPLNRSYLFLAPAFAESPLRNLVAGFSRLELTTGTAAVLPNAPEDIDRMLGTFGSRRSRIAVEAQGNGEPWYLPDFSLTAHLGDLLGHAYDASEALTYQGNFWPYTPSDASLRQCARNLLKIERLAGVPAPLLEMQRRIGSRVGLADYLVEEYVGATSIGFASDIGAQLEEQFCRTHRHVRFPSLAFPFYAAAFDDEIESGFHRAAVSGSAPPEEWVEACSFARLLEAALWTPDAELQAVLPQPVRDIPASERGAPLPQVLAPAADREYLFVSYSRADYRRVSALLETMRERRIEYWYDQHIPGGADWHEMLEERIASCSIFVLMLSPNAANSKYVRREIAFADSIGKPLLTVQLEPAGLVHGLSMLLGQYQMIESEPARFGPALTTALAYLRSQPR